MKYVLSPSTVLCYMFQLLGAIIRQYNKHILNYCIACYIISALELDFYIQYTIRWYITATYNNVLDNATKDVANTDFFFQSLNFCMGVCNVKWMLPTTIKYYTGTPEFMQHLCSKGKLQRLKSHESNSILSHHVSPLPPTQYPTPISLSLSQLASNNKVNVLCWNQSQLVEIIKRILHFLNSHVARSTNTTFL
jgi:hypothetical protein